MTLAVDRLSGGPAQAAGELRAPDRRVLAAAGLLLAGGMAALGATFGWHLATLYLLGGTFGLVLYHAGFGFSSAWRRFLGAGRGDGLRAQMLMLAVATAIFLPLLAQGSLFGQALGGAIAPLGVSVLVGALLFGIGMQLGGGCASGTLYTVGGGSTRMVITLVFFMVGSLIGSLHMPWWLAQPSFGSIGLLAALGLGPALTLQLGLFALLAYASVVIERRRYGGLGGARSVVRGWRRLLQGPWPLVWGAVALALLNGVTLVLTGHPWSIAFGYTLWGAKAASAAGLDVASWTFWTWPFPKQALAGSVFADGTSVMNFGIMAGAFLAAGLAGRFAPARRVPLGAALAAVAGGLLMGYGARLAFGCNVGALFSGIASGSLHGWLWLVAGLAGSYIGIWLRPLFRLDPVRTPPGGC
ncbi:MAG: YeeE/YedE family protein [Kiloniellales bacterium]